MKLLFKTVAAAIVLSGVAGCASPYMTDRRRDAADIFTAAVCAGFGASARLGPIAAGITESADLAGLRGGRLLTFDVQARETVDVKIACFGFEWLAKNELEPRHKTFISATGVLMRGPPDDRRHIIAPFVSVPYNSGQEPTVNWAQMTQLEVQASCLLGVRLGFNPGELLDFILGWTTIDLFNDDLEWKKRKSNGIQEGIVTRAPNPQR